MRSRLLSSLALLLLALLVQPGHAQGEEARGLIEEGEFARAYEVAVREQDPESQILAARAASYQAMYRETDADSAATWLGRAEDAASRALELAPENAHSHFELARAKGLAANSRGSLRNINIATELKRLFEKTLELDPEHPEALAALAHLNLELSERGVAWLFGGDRDRVVPLFERAIAADPTRVNLRVEYGIALDTLGRTDEAIEQMQHALELEATDAVAELEQERARRRLEGLGGGPP